VVDIIALLEQACGGRCNAENNPCEYKKAALELQGLKPVAWMQDSVELYVNDCPTESYTIPLYTAPVKQTPVAWRKKANGIWHYFDKSTPFPFDDCEPLYEKN
jgi:hypothetical protein